MGNTSSSVTSGVKNQVNSASCELYKLADLGGGGLFVELAKEARQSDDFSELDARILAELPKFLYREGAGQLLPICDVISMRHKERTGQEFGAQTDRKQSVAGPVEMIKKRSRIGSSSSVPVFKEACWRLDERGSVGETILHVCFLCGSSDHMVLARRIISHYPKLINDVYLADEYYGENVLHMAIVNEDPEMVRFLLRQGANVNQRCCGNFFTPDDQKATRTDSKTHEWVDLSPKTRYTGQMYWGEYPLSFAACLSQEECFRLLMAKRANPNAQDTNGNTVLHIMVIHENLDMFDLAFMLGAQLHIQNRQKLTPLTLAAKLAKKEMFDHVLDKEKEVYWTYGGSTCCAYPLEFVDTIQPQTGQININSALSLVVYGLRFICESLVLVGALGYLMTMVLDISNVGYRLYFISLSGFPAKATFLISCTLIPSMAVCRFLCAPVVEDTIGLIAVLLTSTKFLYFCRGFKMVGPFVLMIYKIIVGDLLRFFLIYLVFVMGFMQSFFIIFLDCYEENEQQTAANDTNENDDNILGNVFEAFNRMFIMSLNEFGEFYEGLESCNLAGVGKLLFIIYILLVSVLLINMLIAMMANTYTEISQTKNEWLRQWAAIILMLEQNLSRRRRLFYQSQYSSPMRDRTKRALVVSWRLSEEEQAEMREEREERFREYNQEHSSGKRPAGSMVRERADSVLKALGNRKPSVSI